jgi:hypothetical protein
MDLDPQLDQALVLMSLEDQGRSPEEDSAIDDEGPNIRDDFDDM